MSRMLALDALLTADMAYSLILDINERAANGRQADALAALSQLGSVVASQRPVLRGVINAQRQAAQALHLSESSAFRVLASIGVPAEQPHASNDKQSITSEQPGPSVA